MIPQDIADAEIAPELALATKAEIETERKALEKLGNQLTSMTPQQYRAAEINEVLLPAYAKASQLELTDAEIAALTAPFPDDAVEIRPHDGLIYIPHIAISDRLNKVLRPGRWALLCRRHWLEGGTMYGEYVLLIRGCVVGESTGGHPYQPNNPKVNYSDTLESTAGEALRRICGKRLSCGSQVWNPEYARQWQAKYAVQVHGKWQRRFAESVPQRPAASSPLSTPAGPVSEPPQVVRFDETKFRQSAETWLESERVKWVKENTNVSKWTYAVVNGMILPTEQLSAVTWSKLWGADVLEEAVERIRKGTAESGAKRGMSTRLIERASVINREALSIGISETEQRAFEAAYGPPGTSTAEPEKPRPPKAEARKEEPSSAEIPTTCPKCNSTVTKTSKDYELVSWCEKCGHQWTEGGKAWEAHEWMTVPLPFAGKDKQDYVGKTLGQIARIDHKYFFGITENCEYPAQAYKGKEPSMAKKAFAEACKEARDHRAANKAGAVDAMREGVAEEPNGLPF